MEDSELVPDAKEMMSKIKELVLSAKAENSIPATDILPLVKAWVDLSDGIQRIRGTDR